MGIMKTMRKLAHRKNVQPRDRKIEHIFPSINGYKTLSDSESVTQPLLHDNDSEDEEAVQENCLKKSEKLEKDVSDLRENIFRVESRLESYIYRPPSKQRVGAKLDDLEHRLVKLELEKLPPPDPKREVAIEEIRKYNAAIEKKTAELETKVTELKSACLNIKETLALADTVAKETEANCLLINKLIYCTVVLIFVICFQIGYHL